MLGPKALSLSAPATGPNTLYVSTLCIIRVLFHLKGWRGGVKIPLLEWSQKDIPSFKNCQFLSINKRTSARPTQVNNRNVSRLIDNVSELLVDIF